MTVERDPFGRIDAGPLADVKSFGDLFCSRAFDRSNTFNQRYLESYQ